MAKTAAYIRVSTSKQLDGAGPQQQRNNLLAYAVSKGLHIDEYATDDETGTTEDREHIQRLLKEAQAGTLTLLLVDRLDRLGRKLHVCEGLLAAFNQAGCEVQFVAAAFADNPAGVAMRQMLGVFAEYQRSEWLSRMRQCSKAKAVARGSLHGALAPYGYRIEGNRCVPDPTETPLVKKIFALSAQKLTLRGICKVLMEEGWKTRKGTYFHHQQVKRILELEQAYRGQVAFVDAALPAAHHAIL